jgi:CRP/FNR family transcriptional regulator, cyclic AMP receptor protein
MSSLSVPVQEEFLALGNRYEYPAEIPLVHQGTDGTDVYLLESASPPGAVCAKVALVSPNGCTTLLGLRTGGDLIGESAALLGSPRTATVVITAPTGVYKFRRSTFIDFVQRTPEANLAVLRTIARRLEWANRRRLEIAGYPVRIRLTKLILEVLGRHGRKADHGADVGAQLSQREWGQLIGASEGAVRQTMKILQDLGLIENHYRGLVVTDLDGLRRYAK